MVNYNWSNLNRIPDINAPADPAIAASYGYTSPVSGGDLSTAVRGANTPNDILARERMEQHRLLRTWFSQQRMRQQGNQAERGSAGGAGGTGVSSRPQMAPGGVLGGTSLLGG